MNFIGSSSFLLVDGANVDAGHPHGDLDRIVIDNDIFPRRPASTRNHLRGMDIAFAYEALIERDWATMSESMPDRRVYLNFQKTLRGWQVDDLIGRCRTLAERGTYAAIYGKYSDSGRCLVKRSAAVYGDEYGPYDTQEQCVSAFFDDYAVKSSDLPEFTFDGEHLKAKDLSDLYDFIEYGDFAGAIKDVYTLDSRGTLDAAVYSRRYDKEGEGGGEYDEVFKASGSFLLRDGSPWDYNHSKPVFADATAGVNALVIGEYLGIPYDGNPPVLGYLARTCSLPSFSGTAIDVMQTDVVQATLSYYGMDPYDHPSFGEYVALKVLPCYKLRDRTRWIS